MPQPKRGKPKRSKKRKPDKRLAAMRSHILKMEEPLRETGDLVRALCLMGDGLHYSGDEAEARAVSAVAWTTLRRADALQEEWKRLVEVR